MSWPGIALLAAGFVLSAGGAQEAASAQSFSEVSLEAGFDYSHGAVGGEPSLISGGVAAGDYDGDGDVDLYVIGGDAGPNRLYRNLGDGHFEEIGAAAGVDLLQETGSGPVFADFDGDGFLDLTVNGVRDARTRLLRSLGDGRFADVTESSGLQITQNTMSGAYSDFDLDGDLDLFLTHWGTPVVPGVSTEQVFTNDGHGNFSDASVASGVAGTLPQATTNDPLNQNNWQFTPNLSDVNGDGFPDLLVSADFGTSQVLLNQRDGTFADATTDVISDENGMGGTAADYDNDGDIDWFVSSIYQAEGSPTWGVTGNRLYRNEGRGVFSDVTDLAGVREGGWGWGSCWADFNNDGNLDLLHVNGFVVPPFDTDPSRLFLSNGDGTFTESSTELGFVDHGNGRGLVCFDYDRDGDVDVFIANNNQPPALWRNDGLDPRDARYLGVRLHGPPGNTQGIGATVYLWSGRNWQMREIKAGSNFVSQDPAEAHFGLGARRFARWLVVRWPDGHYSVRRHVRSNRVLDITHPRVDRWMKWRRWLMRYLMRYLSR